MIAMMSWKNVWRNKMRSLIVVSAVTLGTIAGVFVAGLMNGWVQQRIHAAIYTEVSHIKLQNPAYLNNEELTYTIANSDTVETYLQKWPQVKAYAKHIKIMAMGSTAHGSTSFMLMGINPEKEKLVSDVYTCIDSDAGTYFETPHKLPSIVISDKIADNLRLKNHNITQAVIDTLQKAGVPESVTQKLIPLMDTRFLTDKKFKTAVSNLISKAEQNKYGGRIMKLSKKYKLRSRIVVNYTKLNGEIGYQSFSVSGVYKTSNSMFDSQYAFANQNDLRETTGLSEGQFHEFTIILNDDFENLSELKTQIAEKFPSISVLTWKEMAPDAGMMSDFMQIYYYVLMGIIFFALAFGIINTMLMAILERVKEIGMLMAIGMNNKRVFKMIVYETIFLTLTGCLIGMALGGALIALFGKIGLNFASVQEGFEAFGWAAQVYPTIEPSFFFGVTLMVIVIGILSSIIPSRKALKMKPVEALRIE